MSDDTMRGMSYALNAGAKVAFSAAATTRSAQLGHHRYLIVSDSNAHVRLGGSATDATVNDFRLPANTPVEIEPWPSNDYLCMIAPAAGSGNMYIASRRSW